MPARSLLPRYWRSRSHDGQGVDIDAALAFGNADLAGLTPLSEVIRHRCAVLLGPPGGGKTTELNTLLTSLGLTAVMVEVGRSSTEDGLQRRIAAALAAQQADPTESNPRLLALDALDESPLTPTVLAGALDEALQNLPAGVHLAVSCRTAGWLPGIDAVLHQNLSDVEIYDLAPLTTADIEAYARSSGLDGQLFLEELRQSGAVDLARNPVELTLLVGEFRASPPDHPSLPSSQAQLFESGCRRRVREPNALRRNPLKPPEERRLLASAGTMALVALSTGRSTFVLDGDAGPEELTADDCLPASPRRHFVEVLATQLFAGAGPQRMRFEHQTLAEYVAAAHVVSAELPLERVNDLLGSPDGLLAPQVQAVAAWLAALAPQHYGSLLDRDPAAFIRTGIEMVDPAYRAVLVDRLLILAGRNELPGYSALDLSRLDYDGIVQRLQQVLHDPKSATDARTLAVLIARRSNCREMSSTLATVAVDVFQPVPVRVAAGYGVLDFADSSDVARLVGLLDVPGDLDDDELFGLGLRALQRGGTPLPDVLGHLRNERNSHLIGSYSTFLKLELPTFIREKTLSAEDIAGSLAWTAQVVADTPPWMSPLRGLAAQTKVLRDEILLTGLRNLQEPLVFAAVVNAMAVRVENHYHRLFESRAATLPDLTRESRRDLVSALHDRLDSAFAWALTTAVLLDADDFAWVVNNAAQASTSEEAERWRSWIGMLFDRERLDHRAALTAIPPGTPFADRIVVPLLQPPEPANLDTDIDEPDTPPPPTDDQLRRKLLESLQLSPERAFFVFCHYVRLNAGARYSPSQPGVAVSEMYGWSLLDAEQRGQAVTAAQDYLETATENGEHFLGTGRSTKGAYAGVQALVLLAEMGDFPNLAVSRWRFWAPALAAGPFFTADEQLLQTPLRWVSTKAHDALLAAIAAEVTGRGEAGQFALRRIASCLTRNDNSWLIQLITEDRTDFASSSVAFELLAKLDPPIALTLLDDQLRLDCHDSRKTWGLVSTAIQVLGARAWPALRSVITEDSDGAREVIGALSEHAAFDPGMLDELQLVEFWRTVEALFPRQDDPSLNEGGIVSRRHNVADLRDQLLPTLAERGTEAAIEQLQLLALQYPQTPTFRYLAARARITAARAAWAPLAPSEVLALLDLSRDTPVKIISLRTMASIIIGLAAALIISTLFWQRDGLESSTWIAGPASGIAIALAAVDRPHTSKHQKQHRWAAPQPYATALTALIPCAIVVLVVGYTERDVTSNTPAAPSATASTSASTPATATSASAITTRPPAHVTVSLTRAAPGTTITVKGEGYLAGEQVRIELYPGANLQSFDGPYILSAPTADASGSIAATAVTVPSEICCAGATTQLTATGVQSHRTGMRYTITLTGK